MWFCCQIWQCSVKSCFSPSLDIQWKGWTHVVYPSVTTDTSSNTLTFLETGLVDDHVKNNIYLQRQKSCKKNESSPVKCFTKPGAEVSPCEIAVDIHSGPGLKGRAGTAPLLRHNSVSSLCPGDSSLIWEDEEEQRVPWRTPSTDWTKLETSLDFWRQEHSKSLLEDRKEPSKVRYNDTGSLEEVSVDNCIDYYVEDDIMVHLEADHENMRQQYRRLWQLRTTLEEDEETKKRVTKRDLMSQNQSPEPDAAGSHTTSFESNTEPLLDEVTRLPPHLLQLPSYETRRQNYRNILNWRMRKMEARNARRHGGRQTSLEDTSFDSMDTEESSTDASRLDQTTSFESTTDNTDSPTEHHVHRLQQLRADSGYRSLENPVPNSQKLLYPQQHVTSSELEPLTHRIPSLGESFEDVSEAEETEETVSVEDNEVEGSATQTNSNESEFDEGVGGLRSSPPLYESPSRGSRRKGGQHSFKKRRDFCGGRGEFYRDYSVDEKSDALFREFSRCELDRQRHRLSNYRRLHGPYVYPELYEPRPGGLLDDEVSLASVPIIRVAADDSSSDQL